MIDIGGPTLLRSSSKNFSFLTTICDPGDYSKLIKNLDKNNGKTSYEFRKQMAFKVFRNTSRYDDLIFKWLKSTQKLKNDNKSNFIESINNQLTSDLGSKIDFRRVENVGPKVSKELLNDGILAITLSLAAMLFYIWIRFEWQFSIGAIVALVHDVIITLGIFSLLSYEINLSIVAAVLTIVGYSMNDTVVIFDRIRENLKKYSKIETKEIFDDSINETLSRTIITSVTTLLALLSIYIFGGPILMGFSFAMIVGVIVGTYSSIFVATPILNYTKVNQKTILKEDK